MIRNKLLNLLLKYYYLFIDIELLMTEGLDKLNDLYLLLNFYFFNPILFLFYSTENITLKTK